MKKHSFRAHLLISQILPMLIFIPLVGLGLIYLLENRVFFPLLANDMAAEGMLLVNDLQRTPQAWRDPVEAQSILDNRRLPRYFRVYLLDPQNRLLATNQSDERLQVGHVARNLPGINNGNEKAQWLTHSQGPGSPPILDVVIPITSPDEQILGRLRMVRRLPELDQGLWEAQAWIVGALVAGLLVNTILALILAAHLTRPLHQMANAIQHSTVEEGQYPPIPKAYFSEADGLVKAVNLFQQRRYEIETNHQQMLGSLVHEIGRPLGSLQIAIHALLTGAEANPSLRKELFKGMAARVESLSSLVNDLSLACLPQHSLELHQQPFQINEWLTGLVPLWAEMARQKGVEWQASWPKHLPVIEGDPARLEQAIGNLVNNAIKFTQPGGRVIFQAGLDDGQICFSVSDTGPGICPEDLPNLFAPFFRAVHTAVTAPGLGLGLSIAKTIAKAHGGEIEVKSLPKQGSTFSLYIPCPSSYYSRRRISGAL